MTDLANSPISPRGPGWITAATRPAPFFSITTRDGLLDLFLTNVGKYTTNEKGRGGYYIGFKDGFSGHLKPQRYEPSILFRNEGRNRFVDVSREVGLIDVSWTGDASPLDVNEDGWPDLYVLNMQGHDEYYENVAGTKFVKKSREIFPKTPWGSMGIKVFDFDNDGHIDIYITDMHSDMSQLIPPWQEKTKARMQWPESYLRSGGVSIYGNAFYRNRGDGRFEEISDRIQRRKLLAVGIERWRPQRGRLRRRVLDLVDELSVPLRRQHRAAK